jgi:4-hydroxymandelate synthase
MKIHGIDHVEFCVGDVTRFAEPLIDAYGFSVHGRAALSGPERHPTAERSLLLRQGRIQFLLRSGLAPDHPAAAYVARHGDGVAAVGFGTDDVEAAFAQAVAGGAEPLAEPAFTSRDGTRVGTATVSGCGDVVHRFVERSGPGDEFAPGEIEMVSPRPTAAGPPLFEAVDHLALCVPAEGLLPAVMKYQRSLGLSEIFDERIEVGGQAMMSKVVQDSAAEVTFTLLEPDRSREPGQIDEFLEAHDGAGVQHVALRTSDIAGAVRALSGRGVEFLSAPAGYYKLLERRLGSVTIPVATLQGLNVLADRDRWGQMFQIFARSTHERRTFFFELIERQGALTFGTKNIKALYEALKVTRGVLATDG